MKAHTPSKATLGISPVSTNLGLAFAGAATTSALDTRKSSSSSITSSPSSKLSSTSTSSNVPLALVATPIMIQLLWVHTRGTSNVTSYFIPMSVLDDQTSFQSAFGLKPQLFISTLTSLKGNGMRDKLYGYSEKMYV